MNTWMKLREVYTNGSRDFNSNLLGKERGRKGRAERVNEEISRVRRSIGWEQPDHQDDLMCWGGGGGNLSALFFHRQSRGDCKVKELRHMLVIVLFRIRVALESEEK